MAVIRTKGTVLQQTISASLTSIAQLISLTVSEAQNEMHDADYLGNTAAGILQQSTGRTTVPTITGEIFYDPVNTTHAFLAAFLATPAAVAGNAGKIILADTGTSEIAYTAGGFGMGVNVALGDGLKAPFTIMPTGVPTYP